MTAYHPAQQIYHSIRQYTRVCRSIAALMALLLLTPSLFAQYYDNPLSRGMAGAGNAAIRGFFCVGHNPANLGLSSPYRTYVQLFGVNGYQTNNFYSLESGTHFGGQDLTADNGKLQREFISSLPQEGWRLTNGINAPLPLVNFSVGNKAFTTSLIQISDYYISRPALDVIFGNWEKGTTYDLDLRCDALTAMEFAYSMAIPYGNMSVGISLKYLQGLAYYGLDPDYSTGQLMVDTSNFVLFGEGEYYFRESNHGRGFGADIGVAFEDLDGWKLGVSVLNLGQSIKWNTETAFSRIIKDSGIDVLKIMGYQIKTFPFRNSNLKLDFGGESYRYKFQIDSLNADYLFRGDSAYQDLFRSTKTITQDTSVFRVTIPVVLKIGLAKYLQKNLLMAIDFSASFTDRLNFQQGWRTAIGFEYSYFPKAPLRVGIALGGINGWKFNIGSGLNLGALHIDWAIGMDRALWAHSMQGFDFALATYLTGSGKKK